MYLSYETTDGIQGTVSLPDINKLLINGKWITIDKIQIGSRVRTTKEYNEYFKGIFSPFCGRVTKFVNQMAYVDTVFDTRSANKTWLELIL